MKTITSVIVLAVIAAAGCSSNIYDVKMEQTLFMDTEPGQTVFVSARNTSTLQDFPLAETIESVMIDKGYVVVDDPGRADVILKLNVRYSGLLEEAMKGDKALAGAATGGVVGGLAGAAGGASRGGTALGALGGMLVGAGLGAWIENDQLKNTFITIVDFQVTEQKLRRPPRQTSIYARVREEDLTMESAAERVRPDTARQIAGLF